MDAKRDAQFTKFQFWPYAGYMLLIASVYLFSTLLKTGAEWHHEGTALYYALSLEQLRLPTGDWIYNHPSLLKLLTWCVYYLELLIPFLILIPLKNGKLRFMAFICIVLLHLGIGLTLYVGLFFVIGMVSAIGLLPSGVMDRIESRFKSIRIPKPRPALKNNNLRFMLNSLCIVVLFLSLLVNLGSLPRFPYQLHDGLTYPVNALRLNQYWGMFSPGVLKKDGWFVYHGMDSVGRQWDLRRNEDYVDYQKPERIVSMYKSDRWRKLAENMQSDNYTFLRPLYCRYILKTWNKKHPKKKIGTLNLYYMEKESLPNYRISIPEKKLYSVCDDH